MRLILCALLLVSQAAFASPKFTEVNKLADQQKLQAALDKTLQILKQAKGDDALTTEALVKATQLEMGLHGYETAVRFLKDTPWPKGGAQRVLLQLFYGYSLMNYNSMYGWEIASREKTVSAEKVDLKAWTREQIGSQISWSFENALQEGPWLDEPLPPFFQEYVIPNSYPPGVRPSLRDAVVYQALQYFVNSQYWSAKEGNELYKLSFSKLASGEYSKRLSGTSSAHPLEKAASWLGELAHVHQGKGQKDAALEAHYALVESLHSSVTEQEDKSAIVSVLQKIQAGKQAQAPWWSRGQALLANLLREGQKPGRMVEARAAAIAGREAFPGSPGARMCESIIFEIERPEINMSAMFDDGIGKRSVLMNFRNVKKVHFRAYPISLEQALKGDPDGSGFLNFNIAKEIKQLREKPAAEWTLDLPATPDFLQHQKFVTPPGVKKGIYLLVASLKPDFSLEENRIQGLHLIFSDLVLQQKRLAGGEVEVRALSGSTGKAVRGAKVSLYSYTYNEKPVVAATMSTDANGYAVFSKPITLPPNDYPNYFFLGQLEDNLAALRENVWFSPNSATSLSESSFIFTDRSVYRPQQKLQFKVVSYSGYGEKGEFKAVAAGTVISVQLFDPNNQVVGTQKLTTNSFGSVSGEFSIPAGHPLGQWRVAVESKYNGMAMVKVEEYKRPTFESSFKDAEEALRLNHKAKLTGEARYYFGLPVTGGKVQWRVTRTEINPWWWGYWGYWHRPSHRNGQVVASGTSELGKDGKFSVEFTPEADERRKKDSNGLTYDFHLEADVTDEGGETRSASRNFRLGFVAVEAKLDWEKGFFTSGKPSEILARLANLDGKPLKGAAHYRVQRLKMPSGNLLPADLPVGSPEEDSKEKIADDRQRARWETSFQWEAVTKTWASGATVNEGKLDHNEKGEAKIALPSLDPGAYRVSYDTKDSFGALFEVSRDFVVAGPKSEVNLPLVVVPETASVKPGEVARLFVHSGLTEQPLSLEVFHDGKRIKHSFLESGKSSDIVELPIKMEDRGGFTVVVSGLRDHQMLHSETNIDVPWNDRQLTVEFSSFRDKLKPGQKETVKILVKDDAGKALEQGGAEVLAYMYDRSLDIFSDHSYPTAASIYPHFAGAPGYSLSLGTASAMDMINSLPGHAVPPSYSPDNLKLYPPYGIGGPGNRHRGVMMMADSAGEGAMSGGRAAMPGAASLAQNSQAETKDVAKKVAAKAESAPAPAASSVRSNFSESAFFAPHLILGPGGEVAAEFTVPDSVTSWKMLAHALTKDFRGGDAQKETRSVKELMVRPYIPRFLREGDEAEIKVQVNNASEGALSGEVELDIEDGEGKSVLSEFGITSSTKKSFEMAKDGSVSLTYPVRAPVKVGGDFAFKVVAHSKNFSDGERRPFPVLPSRMHLAQSRFVTLHHKDSKVMEFKDLAAGKDSTLINEQLAVTVDAQLFYGVLQALPYLVNYPYECVEQTLNRFLSTGIVTSIFGKFPATAKMAAELASRKTQFEAFGGEDPNRKMSLEETPWLQDSRGGSAKEDELLNMLNPSVVVAQRDSALAKLEQMQLADGGFPWFQGGSADSHMTLYVLLSLTRALEFKIDIPKPMVVKGWRFLHSWLDEHLERMMHDNVGWEEITMLNFALSGYPNVEWTGGQFNEPYRKKLLDFSFKHWKETAPLVKGYLALTLKRMGREADAKLVWDSVMDSAKHSEELGTYWAREDRSWLWYNDEIETHAFALRTQMELNSQDKHNEGIVQWLFLNKKLNHWKSTRATAEVLYALTNYLDKTAQLGVKEAVKVNLGGETTEFQFDPEKFTGRKNQVVVAGEKVDAKKMSKIEVSKATPGFAFASATWMFSTDKLPKEEHGDFFQVSRRYFRREHSATGWLLKPLAEGAVVNVGDQIEVQLSLRTKHEAEYVHLRDPRAAGMEPENVVSGYKWNLGISWYEETRDSGSNFFFSRMPVGEYTFKYRLRANMAGKFRVAPATVQSMYAPEFNAYSAGNVLKIK